MQVELHVKNATLLTAKGMINNAQFAVKDGRFVYVESEGDGNQNSPHFVAAKTLDVNGALVTPGLIDCHTHLVFGGNRSHEFEWRLQGDTYQHIAQRGGGILSTVDATREASFEALLMSASNRLEAMIEQGVMAVEVKSGYGLDLASEIKMLKVARRLEQQTGIGIHRTFLGAHAVPKEYRGKSDAYVDFLCEDVLPEIKALQLASAVDVFCERIGFSLKQTEKIFHRATELGFAIKCHAEQLSLTGAAQLAATLGALSCDHLEYIDKEGVKMMAKCGSVAVLLPGAFYFLNESQKPPVHLFRQYGVPMAVATDANPGSSPTNSLPLMMNMASVLFGLTVKEVWLGVTYLAARALGLTNYGIALGNQANFLIWPFSQPVELIYQFGTSVKPRMYLKGESYFKQEK